MKTTAKFAPLAAALLLAFNAAAQDHSQHQMPKKATQDHAQHQKPAKQDHSQHHGSPTEKSDSKPKVQPKPKSKPKPKPTSKPAAKKVAKPSKPAAPSGHAATDHTLPPTKPAAVEHGAVDHGTAHPTPMDHAAMGHGMPGAPGGPVTPIPVLTDEDRAAAAPPSNPHPAHGDSVHALVLFNRLEGFDTEHGAGMEWEGQAWVGTDLNKLWLRSEGERVGGETESAGVEVLYGRAVAPWWDVLAGVRHDFKPGASQDFLAIGIQGLAPYKFEVEATAYLGRSGHTAARVEAEYETLLTNRLILQPLVELSFHGKNDERRGIGSGLSTAEAGLRLRYEITRQFAPYIGVVRERAFGRTAEFRRDAGDDVDDTRVVAGVRIWF